MSERRAGTSDALVYSEKDVAEFRDGWEAKRKEDDRTKELTEIRGQLNGLPELVRTQVRLVLAEEKQKADNNRRIGVRLGLGYVAALMVLVVPLEDVIISHLTTGHP